MQVLKKQEAARITAVHWLFLTALALMAVVSLWQAVHNALTPSRSEDFQWSGTHLLLKHVNPWDDYLRGDPVHGIFKTQYPNYLPALYLFLLPFGLMPMNVAAALWAACNVAFGTASAVLCGRFYGLRGFWCGVLVALLVMSTPMRNTIGNGQLVLFVLMLWVFGLCRVPKNSSGFTLGLSYFKYSFAPPVFVFLWLRIGCVAALLSLAPVIAALLAVYLWLGGSLLHPTALFQLLIAPLKVSRTGYIGLPGPNLMDTLDWYLKLGHVAPFVVSLVAYGVPLVLTVFLLYRITHRERRISWELQVALLAVVSVALFKHHAYDEVVLLFPAAYSLKNRKRVEARWALALICYVWYGERLLIAIHMEPAWGFLLDMVFMMVAGGLLWRMPMSSGQDVDDNEAILPVNLV